MRRVGWSLVLLAFLPGLASGAYLITLKNGNQLVVESYWEEGGEIRYWMDGGEVGIPKDAVESIRPTTRRPAPLRVSPPPEPPPERPRPAVSAPGPEEPPVLEAEEPPRDTVPPTVVATDPKDGDARWYRLYQFPIPIRITFSEPMDKAATEAAFRTKPPMEGTFSWKGTTMTFTPKTYPLTFGVTVTVGTGARDLAGNNLEKPYTFSYRLVILQ